MLYIRMFFMMFLGLFTSRIVLDALGENDYGIYNVVGGVVAMFTIISGSLNGAISRFITFEMGRGTEAQLSKVFSTAVWVQLVISLIVVVIAEPAGLWFIENKMTIDPSRIEAAQWVLHFSLLSFVINLMSVPQMASITAHEKMSAYAYIGILDGLLRFGAAVVISRSAGDKLVLYAILMTLCVSAVRMAYGIYCRRHFPECRFRPALDRNLLKEMLAFAGWDFIGVSSGVLRDQGGNILVNLFFGTAVNASRGIATQLNGVIQGFVTNFMTAVNPQITKSYAAGDMDYMFSLVRKSSRMSYYLLSILALPVIMTADYLLEVWLKEVPEYSASFVRLFLVFSLSESLSRPLITAMLATGKIRNYQLLVGGLQLLNLPVAYILLHMGMPPESTVAVSIVLSQVCLFVRLAMLKRQTGFPMRRFIERVYCNGLIVTALALILPIGLSFMGVEGFRGFFMMAGVTFLSVSASILFVGCSKDERREICALFLKNFPMK